MARNYDELYTRYASQTDKLVKPVVGDLSSSLASPLETPSTLSLIGSKFGVYIAIPVVTFILLLIWGPEFLKWKEDNPEGSQPTLHLSWKRLLFTTLVLSVLCGAGYRYGRLYLLKR